MSRVHSAVAPLHQLRKLHNQVRVDSIAVGSDGRARCLLSPFASKTGRNQPSTSRFIFGAPSCMRSLIKPSSGMAIAYLDWGHQEFGIAAALSGDMAMQNAYRSGDPYLAFAIQSGAVPPGASKATHPLEREQFKLCVLGVQYCMGAARLATLIKMPEVYAQQLLNLHRRTFPKYWEWSEGAVDHAMLKGKLRTVFGWQLNSIGPGISIDTLNPRSLANFLVQANGAEMLRLACCLAVEQGIRVCAPVHDAILVEGPTDVIDAIVFQARAVMAAASHEVLNGFELRTDAKIVRYPDRFVDDRGQAMWQLITKALAEFDASTNTSINREVTPV